jgi:hypothetical protein
MKTQMMRATVAGALAAATLLFAVPAAALDFGLGVKASTLGLGAEGTLGLSPFFNARLGVNQHSYKYDETADDIRYDAELDLNSAALILDWHPFAGTFRISAGLVNNKNAIHMKATPTSNMQIGNNTYTPAQIGSLSGEVEFKRNVPYFGLGWGNAVGKGLPFGFNFEIGIVKQGQADVSLSSSSGLVSQADLDREAQLAEEDLSDFDTYPVISLGFSFRF